MTLSKNKMVRAIGQRTRLKNRDVQTILEALIELWTESIIEGERIELEISLYSKHSLLIEVKNEEY